MLEKLRSHLRLGDFLTRERVRLVCFMMIGGYLLVLGLLFATSDGKLDRMGRPLGTDFSQVWVAGKFALEGQPAAPFDPKVHEQRQRKEFGPDSGFFHWGYPPYFLVIAAFFALFPYVIALLAWQAATLPIYLYAVRRMLPVPDILLLAAAFPAVFVNLGHGHNGFLTAGLMGIGLLLLGKRPVLAGVCFGLVAYKPQFGLLIPLALLAGGHWRAIAGAAAAVIAMSLATWAVFGTETWTAFFASLEYSRGHVAEQGATGWHKIPSIFSAARMWGADVATAYLFQAIATLACAAAVAAVWFRGADWRLSGAVLLTASLLATPYFLDYDMMLMGPAMALYGAYCLEKGFRGWEKSLIALVWIVPIFGRNFAQITLVPISTFVLVAFLILATRRALTSVTYQGGFKQQILSKLPAGLARQGGAFLVAGGLGFLIDASLTIAFTTIGGLSPFVARIPAACIAIVCTWLMNRTWTFSSHDPRKFAELARYGSVSAASALLNYSTYCIALAVAGQAGFSNRDALVIFAATVCGSALAAGNTFVLSRNFAFRGAADVAPARDSRSA